MIKKWFLLLFIIHSTLIGLAQPDLKCVSFPETAESYGLYEITFQLNEYANPYNPAVIDVYAEFTGPDGQIRRINGFYFEEYLFSKEKNYEMASRDSEGDGWKVRFTPDVTGTWSFELHAIDKDGETWMNAYDSIPFTFECKPHDAEGFISLANTKYLKREAMVAGQHQTHAFYPIGPNVAWYSIADYGKYKKPYGIYEYEKYIHSLHGNANYMRIWVNRYQYLSLYGPEHAGTMDGKPHMYFDNTLNQKDAAELDYIVAYAAKHDLALMFSIFNFGDFIHKNSSIPTSTRPAMPSDWYNNPYHTILGLQSKYEFFTDERAIDITKNLLRYIVARWGYATNIMCWELWNEVANIVDGETLSPENQRNIAQWHVLMANYLRSIDPYHHLISTSLGSGDDLSILMETFDAMDFVQDHNYQNIQKCSSKEQFSYVLYQETDKFRQHFGDKPFFMGEFGFGQKNPKAQYADKDPWGIDLHNSLWSSAFSGSMGPASFWFWQVIDENNQYGLFKPLLTFFKTLPIFSDSFTASTTGTVKGRTLVFPNNLETYYMINASEDTLIGWCQDTAFCYQSLRHLTDKVGKHNHFDDDVVIDTTGYVYTLDPGKRPAPSHTNNSIVLFLKDQPVRTRYTVRWFDAETGRELTEEATTVTVSRPLFSRKRITITFPSAIRDVDGKKVNNTFGDAVFMITKEVH